MLTFDRIFGGGAGRESSIPPPNTDERDGISLRVTRDNVLNTRPPEFGCFLCQNLPN